MQSNGQPRDVWMGTVGSPMPCTPIFLHPAHVKKPEVGKRQAVQVLDVTGNRISPDDSVLLPHEPRNFGEGPAGVQSLHEEREDSVSPSPAMQ